jgi:hypothetical protein
MLNEKTLFYTVPVARIEMLEKQTWLFLSDSSLPLFDSTGRR